MRGTLLVVGLGNPGEQYRNTRHNIGWWVLDAFAQAAKISLEEEKLGALSGAGRYAGGNLVLAKPMLFMNRSGGPVAKLLAAEGVGPDRLVVIQDELDLEVGRLKLQKGRSAGGHNGIDDVAQRLNTREFYRFRVGIGRPPQGWDISEYVLSEFAEEELEEVRPAVDRAVAGLKTLAKDGITAAMNDFNRRERERMRARGSEET